MAKYNPNKNYCTASPDKFLWWNWKECCYAHDEAYGRRLKNPITRLEADIALRECIKSKVPKGLKWIAWLYFKAVRKLGWLAW